MGNRWGNSVILYFGGSKITAYGDCSHEIKRRLLLGRKVMANSDSIFKSRYYFANKGLSSQGYGFSNGRVWMWKLDCEESWVPKNWCFWNVVLQKTLESPLDCKQIQPVNPKGNQSWVFIGRTDAKAETPIFRSPHVQDCLIGKDPDAGRHWGQEEKGKTEDEMAGSYHLLDGPEFQCTLGVGDGQGGLVNGNALQCSCLENPRDGGAQWAALWGCTESDTTEAT